MNVYYMCAYYSQWAHENLAKRTQEQWDAYKFTGAVKRNSINGFTTFPWKNRTPERIDSANVDRAREIFGIFINLTLDKLKKNRISIVPVPSKCGLIGAENYRAYSMVTDALAGTRWADSVEPIIRFTTQLQKASEGGSREREFLRGHMRLTHYPRHDDVILIDDLITTGGSLLACYDILAEWKRPPSCAICCGKTVADSLTPSFGRHMKRYDPAPASF